MLLLFKLEFIASEVDHFLFAISSYSVDWLRLWLCNGILVGQHLTPTIPCLSSEKVKKRHRIQAFGSQNMTLIYKLLQSC